VRVTGRTPSENKPPFTGPIQMKYKRGRVGGEEKTRRRHSTNERLLKVSSEKKVPGQMVRDLTVHKKEKR